MEKLHVATDHMKQLSSESDHRLSKPNCVLNPSVSTWEAFCLGQ